MAVFDAKALRNLGGKWRKEKVKVGRVEKKVWPRPSAPLQLFVLSGICTTCGELKYSRPTELAVGLQPAGAMKLTVLLCCLVHGSADTPQILSVNTADTDNADRNFSTGDTITISFSALTPSGSLSFLWRIANTQTATNEGVFLPNKAAVDALLQFSVSLGAAYTAKWSSIASFLQQLVVTVVNPAGADYTALHAFAFNVSCVPGAIALESPTAHATPGVLRGGA